MTAQTNYDETMAIGFAGMVDPLSNPQYKTMRNDEATAEVRFGVAVKYDDRTNDDTSAALLTATSEIVPGIVAHSHAYDSEIDLGDDGVLPTKVLNVLRSGRILVLAEAAVNTGDPLFVRAVATGGELKGALSNAADASDMIDMTGRGQWDSKAAAGALAWLRVDFLNPVT